MKPKIIFQKIEPSSANLGKQRFAAHSLLLELTGKKVKHSKTGRPIIDQTTDVSISHKNDLACVGIVPAPYKIGVDVEHIKNDINAELFLKSAVAKTETVFLKKICEKKNLPISSGIALIWSIKEAFFKCLDYDLKPGKINILNIYKNNKVKIGFSQEIESLMKEKKLKLCFAKAVFDEKHIYSQVVMRKN